MREAINRRESFSKISAPERFMKDGEAMIADVFRRVDFQKISFKNVTINFDYDWINAMPDFEESSLPVEKQ